MAYLATRWVPTVMYVPPATGSDMRVWNAVIPPNWTVLHPRQPAHTNQPQRQTKART